MKQTKKISTQTVKLTFGRTLINVTNVYKNEEKQVIAFNTLSGLYIFKYTEVLAIS